MVGAQGDNVSTAPLDNPNYPKGGRSRVGGGRGLFYDVEAAKRRAPGDEEHGIGIWVDMALSDRSRLIRMLQKEGAYIVSFHDDPETSLLILSPKSVRIFNMYCHPSWLDKDHRLALSRSSGGDTSTNDSWKRKVMLKAPWVDACVKLGEFLGDDEGWGGLRAGGPPAYVGLRHHTPSSLRAYKPVSLPVGSVKREPEAPITPVSKLPSPSVTVPATETNSARQDTSESEGRPDGPPVSAPSQALEPVSALTSTAAEDQDMDLTGAEISFSGEAIDDAEKQEEFSEDPSFHTAARPDEVVFERIRTPPAGSQASPRSSMDPVETATFFAGLRFWIDMARPNRVALVKGIKRAGGRISSQLDEATHVLVHFYDAAKWDRILLPLVRKGIWCMKASWASKCIAAGRKIPEMGEHVPGGAPIDPSDKGALEINSVNSPRIGVKPGVPTSALDQAISRRVQAGMLENVAAMIRDLNDEFNDVYSENHWRTIITDWREKRGRFLYLPRDDSRNADKGELASESRVTTGGADIRPEQTRIEEESGNEDASDEYTNIPPKSRSDRPSSGRDGSRRSSGQQAAAKPASDASMSSKRILDAPHLRTDELAKVFQWASEKQDRDGCTYASVSREWCAQYPESKMQDIIFRTTWLQYRRRLGRFSRFDRDELCEIPTYSGWQRAAEARGASQATDDDFSVAHTASPSISLSDGHVDAEKFTSEGSNTAPPRKRARLSKGSAPEGSKSECSDTLQLSSDRISNIFSTYEQRVKSGGLSMTELGAILAAKHGTYNAAAWATLYDQFQTKTGRFARLATHPPAKRKKNNVPSVVKSKWGRCKRFKASMEKNSMQADDTLTNATSTALEARVSRRPPSKLESTVAGAGWQSRKKGRAATKLALSRKMHRKRSRHLVTAWQTLCREWEDESDTFEPRKAVSSCPEDAYESDGESLDIARPTARHLTSASDPEDAYESEWDSLEMSRLTSRHLTGAGGFRVPYSSQEEEAMARHIVQRLPLPTSFSKSDWRLFAEQYPNRAIAGIVKHYKRHRERIEILVRQYKVTGADSAVSPADLNSEQVAIPHPSVLAAPPTTAEEETEQGNPRCTVRRAHRPAYTAAEEVAMAHYVADRLPLPTAPRAADWRDFAAVHPSRTVYGYVEHYRVFRDRIDQLDDRNIHRARPVSITGSSLARQSAGSAALRPILVLDSDDGGSDVIEILSESG